MHPSCRDLSRKGIEDQPKGSLAATNPLIYKSLRWLGLLAQVLAVVILLLWLGDWIVFRIHDGHGDAFETIQVQQYLDTPLKGSKEEYDYLGTEAVNCVRAIFPHSGDEPCWWLRRHTTQWE